MFQVKIYVGSDTEKEKTCAQVFSNIKPLNLEVVQVKRRWCVCWFGAARR